jgi:ribosome assembly protein YihI (activator of Der GTPase)
MIGKKIYKNNKEDMSQYTETAIWCNANNAHIEDKGSYYEVCENVTPEPTIEEKLAQLDSDYQSQKQELINQYTDDMLHGDTDAMDADREAMTELDAWYDEEYARIEGSEE